MKKLLTIILVSVLTLSMAACGSGLSKEEMLEKAEEWSFGLSEDILATVASNPTKLDDYVGKIVKNTRSMVYTISRDGTVQIVIAGVHVGFTLSDEELAQISKGDVIQIVGIIGAIDAVGDGAIVALTDVYLIENKGQ